MEQVAKYHLDRIKSLSRGALRDVQRAQLAQAQQGTSRNRGKEDKEHINLDSLLTSLLLITENVRMIKLIEKLEVEGDSEHPPADDVADTTASSSHVQ